MNGGIAACDVLRSFKFATAVCDWLTEAVSNVGTCGHTRAEPAAAGAATPGQ